MVLLVSWKLANAKRITLINTNSVVYYITFLFDIFSFAGKEGENVPYSAHQSE